MDGAVQGLLANGAVLMPRREGTIVRMETLTVEARRAEPDRCQEHWYRLLAAWCAGNRVLDVGAGTGYGIDMLLGAGAAVVHGIDPLPLREDILRADDTLLDGLADGAYHWVVALDVIEHVEDDAGLLRRMLRVASKGVFLTTPNWHVSRARNPYHIREYTPEELTALVGERQRQAWESDRGHQITEVQNLMQVKEVNMAVRLAPVARR